jgi:hypothetical protein
MSHLINRHAASSWRARARGAPKARARRGQRRAAERSGAALFIKGQIRQRTSVKPVGRGPKGLVLLPGPARSTATRVTAMPSMAVS